MTNLELIAEIRRPGPVAVTVSTGHDVVRIIAQKADLILLLQGLRPHETAFWTVVSTTDGVRNLDLNHEGI